MRKSEAGREAIELVPPAPRAIELVAGGGLLAALGLAPLPPGQYGGLRLVVAASGEAANTVHTPGAGDSTLQARGAAHAGLMFDGEWTVPQGHTGELVLQGFDACRSLVPAGKSDRYLLRPHAAAVVQLRLTADGTPVPVREYTVNAPSEGIQVNPAAARLAGGGHVIAWQSGYPAVPAVCSRRYGLDGLPSGPQHCLQDSDVVAGPAVAALSGGGHALAWTVALPGSSSVRTQALDAAGAATAAAQTVNTSTSSYIGDLSMAHLAGGGYVVAWRSLGAGAVSVRMRQFGADGAPLGPERTVIETGVLDEQLPASMPSALALPGGGFAIAWARAASAGAQAPSIYLQRFAATGAALAGPALLMAGQGSTNLNALGGGLLMAYRRDGLVRLQRVGMDGTLLAPEVTPYPEEAPPPGCVRYTPWPTPCTVIQDLPATAALDDGGYVVAWESLTVPYVGNVLWARRFAADDAPRGAATALTDGMTQHAVAARSDGGFALAWRAANTTYPADWAEILARQYSSASLVAGP